MLALGVLGWITLQAQAATAPGGQATGVAKRQIGTASVYARKLDGRATASGETFDAGAKTAAHRSLPLGSEVRVTSLRTRKSVKVRITDRGPNAARRLIDLSPAAASALGMRRRGLERVRIDVLAERPKP